MGAVDGRIGEKSVLTKQCHFCKNKAGSVLAWDSGKKVVACEDCSVKHKDEQEKRYHQLHSKPPANKEKELWDILDEANLEEDQSAFDLDDFFAAEYEEFLICKLAGLPYPEASAWMDVPDTESET